MSKAIVTQTANSTTDRLQLDATDSTDTTADMQPTGSLLAKKQSIQHVFAYIYNLPKKTQRTQLKAEG